MKYPEKRTVRWFDDETGEDVGSCVYVREDLYLDLKEERDRLQSGDASTRTIWKAGYDTGFDHGKGDDGEGFKKGNGYEPFFEEFFDGATVDQEMKDRVAAAVRQTIENLCKDDYLSGFMAETFCCNGMECGCMGVDNAEYIMNRYGTAQ